MKYANRLLILMITFLNTLIYTTNNSIHKKQVHPFFCIVIPSYNNAQWYKKNIASVFCQTYPHYRMIYIDDCSADNTGILVQEYIEKNSHNNICTIIKNKKRKGALANLYVAIHACNNNEIVVTLDGDDWFAHENVLTRLAEEYKKGVVLTYGQYTHPWGGIGCPREIAADVIAHNTYRQGPLLASHLRTFYAGLFKKIALEDLLYQGAFFPMTWDWAMMFPMLEMSGGNFSFIKDILYVYNTENPINDSKVDGDFQIYLSQIIQQKKPYVPIATERIIQESSNQKPTYAHVIFDTKTDIYDINRKLKMMLAVENKKQTDYILITKKNTSINEKDVTFLLQKLQETKAQLGMQINLQKKPIRNNITNRHYTPLYNNIYTFQLGWKPQISIETINALIISVKDFNNKIIQNTQLITKNIEIAPELQHSHAHYTGLLYIQNKKGYE